MESVTLGQSPRSLEVSAEVVHLFDRLEQGGVDGLHIKSVHSERSHARPTHLLLRLLLFWESLLLLALAEEFSLLGRLCRLSLGKVGVVDVLGDGDGRDVDFGGCSDNVGLANSSERNTVEPETLAKDVKHPLFTLT